MRLQFWSFDIIFAVIVFTVTLTVISFVWFDITNQLSLSYGGSSTIMQIQAQTLAYSISYPGNPSYWNGVINTTNASTWSNIGVGLESSGGSGISMKKVYALQSMSEYNYQATKQLLGIGYDYYIQIYNKNINIDIGRSPIGQNPYTVYVIKRSANIEGEPVTVVVMLWSGTSFGVE